MRKWLFLVPLLTALPPPTFADSIWDRRDPRAAFLFNDTRARNVGDLLTVSISESTANNDREQRTMSKSTDARLRNDFTGSSGSSQASKDIAMSGNAAMDLRSRSNRDFSGSAQMTGSRTFTDLITVTVVDVMPNGNLVVEGYRSRVIQGEERMLRITGVVRPIDIGQSNTVLSQYVANFRVSYLGRGPQSSYVNQGFLSRLMNRLWPW